MSKEYYSRLLNNSLVNVIQVLRNIQSMPDLDKPKFFRELDIAFKSLPEIKRAIMAINNMQDGGGPNDGPKGA
jgi:hypothetical protein